MEAQRAKDSFATFISKAKEINGKKLLITKIDDFAPGATKLAIEMLSKKLGESVVVFCSMKNDGTTFIIAKVSDGLTKTIQAGAIVSKIAKALGGNGGGRPQLAQGMGKTQEGIDDILLEIDSILSSSL